MNIHGTNTRLAQLDADAIVVPLFADDSRRGPIGEFDQATGGLVTRLVERKELMGKKYELVPLLAHSGIKAGQVLVVGLGDASSLDSMTVYRASAAASRHLAGKERKSVALFL